MPAKWDWHNSINRHPQQQQLNAAEALSTAPAVNTPTGRALPHEFNTHIPVLWPTVGYVSVALARASSAQTGERLAASSRVCTNYTVGGHVHCTGSDEPWAPAPGLAAP